MGPKAPSSLCSVFATLASGMCALCDLRVRVRMQRLADALESAGKALEELGTGAQTDVTLRHSQQFLEALRVSCKGATFLTPTHVTQSHHTLVSHTTLLSHMSCHERRG